MVVCGKSFLIVYLATLLNLASPFDRNQVYRFSYELGEIIYSLLNYMFWKYIARRIVY